MFPKRYCEHLHLPLVEQTGSSAPNLQHLLIHSNDSFDSVHEKRFVSIFSFFFLFLYIITPVGGNSECHFGHWMNHLFNYFIPKHWFVHEWNTTVTLYRKINLWITTLCSLNWDRRTYETPFATVLPSVFHKQIHFWPIKSSFTLQMIFFHYEICHIID